MVQYCNEAMRGNTMFFSHMKKYRSILILILSASLICPAFRTMSAQQEEPTFPESEEKARTILIDWIGGLWGIIEGGGIIAAIGTSLYTMYKFIQNMQFERELKLNEEWNKEFIRRENEYKHIRDLKKDKVHRRFKAFRPLDFGNENFDTLLSTSTELISSDYSDRLRQRNEHLYRRMQERGLPECLIDHQAKLNTLLHLEAQKNKAYNAIKIGDLEGLKHLITTRPSLVNAQDENGDTLLHFAAALEIYDIVIFLLEHGAIANTANNNGHTPLVMAANSNSISVFNILLNNHISLEELSAVFHIVSQRSDTESPSFFSSLLQRGLHRRLRLSDIPRCSPTAPIGTQNSLSIGGLTVLHEAVLARNLGLIKLLLTQEVVAINDQDESGNTALHCAIATDFSPNFLMVELLLDNNHAGVNVQNNLGNTPLHNAVYRRNNALLQRLLQIPEVNPDIVNKQLQTPLFIACQCLYKEMIILLLVRSNITVLGGNTPLHVVAPLHGTEDVLGALIEHFISNYYQTDFIDTEDSQGNTALHLAVASGNELAVATLVSFGANIRSCNHNHETPWDIATEPMRQIIQQNLPRNIDEP